MRKRLETAVRELTRPINGQYPRPWMTEMADPENAEVFIVGYNQATGFPVGSINSHETYVSALFNVKSGSCRRLYDKMRGNNGPSPTRKNIDSLNKMLLAERIEKIIETNVICYSTPMSSDLGSHAHTGGKEAGREIFLELIRTIRPKVLIAHGEGTKKELERVLGVKAPALPENGDGAVCSVHQQVAGLGAPYDPMIIFVPSLAPPKWNSWSNWAPAHLKAVASQASKFLRS